MESVTTEDLNKEAMEISAIVPDEHRCKCFTCKRQDVNKEGVFVYLVRGAGLPDVIVHRKCLPSWMFDQIKEGEVKRRTVARIWHARGWPPKLKSVGKKREKVDFSIPKEMRPKKR